MVKDELAPMRERYQELSARQQSIEDILQAGPAKPRKITQRFLQELRQAVGLRPATLSQAVTTEKQQNTAKEPRWISFKEADEFFIRLLDPSGETVFLSQAFSAPKEMGQAMRALQNGQFKLEETEDRIILYVDEKEIASLSPEQGELVRQIGRAHV